MKKISNSILRTYKLSNKEFNLENTLLNGQCFNWKKLNHDHFEGVFNKFYVELKRTSPAEFSYSILPDENEIFLPLFEDYLNVKVKVVPLFKQWSAKDETLAKIIKQLPGFRCLK